MEEELLCGERPLQPDEVSFVYGVHRQDERLQFTLKNDVATDEVFGMEPGRDDDVTMFAYYDLKHGEVYETLDVKVYEEDGSKSYYAYRLSPEEKALLLSKMNPYCLEKTGMRLEAHREQFRLEQSALRPEPHGKQLLNEAAGKRIVFTDTAQHELFRLPDGGNLVMRMFGGDEVVRPCVYVDERRFAMGSDVHDTREFAETMAQNGWTYRPQHPEKGDVCDTYEVYQLKDGPDERQYAFMPYSYAKGKLRPAHYERVYAGVLARETTLEDLFIRHNKPDRPFGQQMRSMSMSDIVVLNRGDKRQAFYVDRVGFTECKEFLNPPRRTKSGKKRSKPER